MRKSQKIIVTLYIIILNYILFFPPAAFIHGNGSLFPKGRIFVFGVPESGYYSEFGHIQIDLIRLLVELLAVSTLAGSLFLLFGRRKEKPRANSEDPEMKKLKKQVRDFKKFIIFLLICLAVIVALIIVALR